jgi:hypothetical protein
MMPKFEGVTIRRNVSLILLFWRHGIQLNGNQQNGTWQNKKS